MPANSVSRATSSALACAVALAYAGPSAAHHSAAMFDTTQNVVVDGIVTRYDWRNPHVYMTLRVTTPAATSTSS